MLTKIVSGGQTGVDRAALRAALAAGLEIGGWCPPGRASDSGPIPLRFPLQDTPVECSPDAPDIPRSQRTEWNVRDSDATLILRPASPTRADPGTDFTARCAERYGRPVLIVDPADPGAVEFARKWMAPFSILNVAGPAENTYPGIGEQTYRLLYSIVSAATLT